MATTKQITRNLGGDRLGSGNKNNINLHAYNRSTHDISKTWRSSMNVGTLVPFYVNVGLNGDSFPINLNTIVRTLPSRGPLYGSYKLQIDMFECPIRLYNGLLHNNVTELGLNMAGVKFPKIELQALVKNRSVFNEDLEKSQISKSSLINYLGLNGIGDATFAHTLTNVQIISRKFNAIPLIAYYDIYKNYYANKQEKQGAFICANPVMEIVHPTTVEFWNAIDGTTTHNMVVTESEEAMQNYTTTTLNNSYDEEDGYNMQNTTRITIKGWNGSINSSEMLLIFYDYAQQQLDYLQKTIYADEMRVNEKGDIEIDLSSEIAGNSNYVFIGCVTAIMREGKTDGLEIERFQLSEIDDMRQLLLFQQYNQEILINDFEDSDFWSKLCEVDDNETTLFKYPQHGLALKTYQSDLFNNWLQTEWIDGLNGINKITAIDTSSGSFEIDAFILGKKIYNMLNRIAVSGGTYEDWQEAVYSVRAVRRAETPIYRGGMSAEIMFGEVVSTAAVEDDPLGTLAGKGGEHNKKGGQIEISCDEPCIIMGIVSITPRVDYSQGNSWILTELDNMDDLHKPALDGIGFEDLLQERMAFWGTIWNDTQQKYVKLAAGKIPAWMNYMTAVNETHGDFAEENKCMFMTLNRRYEYETNHGYFEGGAGITDLTTYIDPRKYNYIFADQSLEAQNFWIQIGLGCEARRVMSAKVIPFL